MAKKSKAPASENTDGTDGTEKRKGPRGPRRAWKVRAIQFLNKAAAFATALQSDNAHKALKTKPDATKLGEYIARVVETLNGAPDDFKVRVGRAPREAFQVDQLVTITSRHHEKGTYEGCGAFAEDGTPAELTVIRETAGGKAYLVEGPEGKFNAMATHLRAVE